MNWKNMKCEIDGKVVCEAKKTDKGIQINCSEDCMKMCREFKMGCC